MKRCAWSLAVLLVLAVSRASDVSDDEYADSEKGHIIAHKYVVAALEPQLSYPIIVQGRNCTVEVVLHNTGSSTAFDVVLVDVLPAGAQLLDGSLSVTFPKISSGSAAKHRYTMLFTSGGSLEVTYLPQGTVTYKADADGSQQTGLTSRSGLFLLTPVQQITRYALYAGTWASLGICRTPGHWRNMAIFLGLVFGLLGANVGVKQFGASRSNTLRKAALQEFEKVAGKSD
ncbi:uncharacterized protein HaLaN_02455 [Haematococcus lacustris]|uniref:Translocon-associated protein subunit beta n=1 Tax=Haematococcus lacustris TaxID=44745 RepID=A0A699YE40_HAELA|nr:hypothetical protein QJQ45_004493 [Haematococcus lacustris]GFH07625.1 uncharacterized protein HaLaN_02455 [Haematococcus lacustris]